MFFRSTFCWGNARIQLFSYNVVSVVCCVSPYTYTVSVYARNKRNFLLCCKRGAIWPFKYIYERSSFVVRIVYQTERLHTNVKYTNIPLCTALLLPYSKNTMRHFEWRYSDSCHTHHIAIFTYFYAMSLKIHIIIIRIFCHLLRLSNHFH